MMRRNEWSKEKTEKVIAPAKPEAQAKACGEWLA